MLRTTVTERLLPDTEAEMKGSKSMRDQMGWKVSQYTEVSQLAAALSH
jgi:hypothetical protein